MSGEAYDPITNILANASRRLDNSEQWAKYVVAGTRTYTFPQDREAHWIKRATLHECGAMGQPVHDDSGHERESGAVHWSIVGAVIRETLWLGMSDEEFAMSIQHRNEAFRRLYEALTEKERKAFPATYAESGVAIVKYDLALQLWNDDANTVWPDIDRVLRRAISGPPRRRH